MLREAWGQRGERWGLGRGDLSIWGRLVGVLGDSWGLRRRSPGDAWCLLWLPWWHVPGDRVPHTGVSQAVSDARVPQKREGAERTHPLSSGCHPQGVTGSQTGARLRPGAENPPGATRLRS